MQKNTIKKLFSLSVVFSLMLFLVPWHQVGAQIYVDNINTTIIEVGPDYARFKVNYRLALVSTAVLRVEYRETGGTSIAVPPAGSVGINLGSSNTNNNIDFIKCPTHCLTPDTDYEFRPVFEVEDVNGNPVTEYGSWVSFKTDLAGPLGPGPSPSPTQGDFIEILDQQAEKSGSSQVKLSIRYSIKSGHTDPITLFYRVAVGIGPVSTPYPSTPASVDASASQIDLTYTRSDPNGSVYYFTPVFESGGEIFESSPLIVQPGAEGATVNPENPIFYGDCGGDTSCYEFLEPLPDGTPGGFSTVSSNTSFAGYFNTLFKIGMGIVTLLAFIMLVIAGFQYMTTEVVNEKDEARKRITNALMGLLIALGIFILLQTINPDLLNLGFGSVTQRDITVDTDYITEDIPQGPVPTGQAYCNNNTYTVDGQTKQFIQGDDWDDNNTIQSDDQSRRDRLAQSYSWFSSVPGAGPIDVNKDNCPKIGDSSCTSLYGISDDVIDEIRILYAQCVKATGGQVTGGTFFRGTSDCEVTVTGGSECWLHSTTTKHLPGNRVIDLRGTNQTFNKYLTGDVLPYGMGTNQLIGGEARPAHGKVIDGINHDGYSSSAKFRFERKGGGIDEDHWHVTF